MSKADKLAGRLKQAAGDLIDDPTLRRDGAKQEERGKAREEAAAAEERAEEKRREVSDLERKTSS